MNRRTKIVATLGPATDDPATLRRVLEAGVDVVRLNYSHGEVEAQAQRAERVRSIAREINRDVGILADLQGPKIRIERFTTGSIELSEGQAFCLDMELGKDEGTPNAVGCAYKDLIHDVQVGDTLLLNDGVISMQIDRIEGPRIHCTVLLGGTLSDRKGINKLGGGLSAAALTDKDKSDLQHAVEIGVDFIAVSFPRSAEDMNEARQLMEAAGGRAALVAKIERAEALDDLAGLVGASDAVMVARGDLGVEIGDAELPARQKQIIQQAREMNKMVITATQMMESMISNPVPTRAEVLDVANAVMDGTDAVMLSAETAMGKYPVKVVQAMARVCVGAERSKPPERSKTWFESHFQATDEAIAMATAWTAGHMHAEAIVALTESGSTPLMMSRVDSQIPIYALTRHERTRHRMALCRGVYPIEFEPTMLETLTPVREAVACLKERGLLADGDRVLVTKGDFTGAGGTNTLKIVTVGEY